MKRHPQILNRAHTALLVVDAQTKLNAVVRNGQQVVEGIVKLVKGFRVLNLPVFSTEQYPQGLGPTDPSITEVLDSAPFQKMSFSCSTVDDLTSQLHQNNVKQVLLVGTEAHVCVQQTALDLLAENFQVQVGVDVVSSRKELDYRTALERMSKAGVILTTVEAALFELLEVSGTSEFKEIARLIK